VDEIPIGGRLQRFASAWATLDDAFAYSVVMYGLRIEFDTQPRQARVAEYPLDEAEEPFVAQGIGGLLSKRAVRCLPFTQLEPAQGTFVSPIFCVPKRDGGKRPCLDLRALNVDVTKRHFKMESLATAYRLIQQGDWMVKLDIKDAYLHVPLAKEHRSFFRFNFRGRTYEFRSLMFGLSSAPRIFTRLAKAFIRRLRAEGIRLVAYLDDILLLAATAALALQHARRTVELLTSLGWVINWDKSELVPAQQRTFLGVMIDSRTMSATLPEDKLVRLRAQVVEMFDANRAGTLTLRTAARVLGSMTASAAGISLARLHQRPLLNAVRPLIQAGTRWDAPISLSDQTIETCAWWLAEFRHWNGVGIIPRDPTCRLTTDASTVAQGATIEFGDLKLRTQFEIPPGQQHRSSNWRELMAIRLALERYGSLLIGQVLEIRSDNWTSLRCIANQGSRVEALNEIGAAIWRQAAGLGLHLTTTFIPGVENTEADRLSRWIVIDPAGYQLHPSIFTELHRRWGPLSVDLFASEINHLLPRFYSWLPAPSALAMDCFRHPWEPAAYAHPPPALILRVLEKVLRQHVQQLVLIAPTWTGAPWWPLLRSMATEPPIALETLHPDVLLPCGGSLPPEPFRGWRLQAWRVSAPPGPHSA
jgi:hypothetical protein